MKKMTIGKRTFLGFGFLCLLCAGISWYSIEQVTRLNTVTASIAGDSLPGLINASQVKSGLAENEIRMFRLIRAETPEQRQAVLIEVNEINSGVADALKRYETSIDTEEDRRNFESLKVRRDEFLKTRELYLGAVESNRVEAEKLLSGALRQEFNSYSKAADVLMEFNATTADERARTMATSVQHSVRWISIISLIGILVGITAAILIVRGTTRVLKTVSASLDDGANQVAAAANQVSASSQSLAEGASEQAASLEETSSSLEEISSMTNRNAQTANQATDLARHARKAAEAGAEDMRAMKTAMQAIQSSSDEIANIIKTIDEIAFQTNILALNAAVEAARAGDAGMGFAVVADEVRSLAQRCAQSAKETATKIEGSLHKTAQGVQLSAKVSEGLDEILAKVRQVDELVAEVATASKEQSQGITQVSTAATQMDKLTQSIASNAEEGAAASEELTSQAQSLKSSVAHLLELVGSQAGTRSVSMTEPSRPKARPHPTTIPVRSETENPLPVEVKTKRNNKAEVAFAKDFRDF